MYDISTIKPARLIGLSIKKEFVGHGTFSGVVQVCVKYVVFCNLSRLKKLCVAYRFPDQNAVC